MIEKEINERIEKIVKMLESYDKKLSETSNRIKELDEKINKMIKKEKRG